MFEIIFMAMAKVKDDQNGNNDQWLRLGKIKNDKPPLEIVQKMQKITATYEKVWNNSLKLK